MFAKYLSGSTKHCLFTCSELSQLIVLTCLPCIVQHHKFFFWKFSEKDKNLFSPGVQGHDHWLSVCSHKEEPAVFDAIFLTPNKWNKNDIIIKKITFTLLLTLTFNRLSFICFWQIKPHYWHGTPGTLTSLSWLLSGNRNLVLFKILKHFKCWEKTNLS